MSLSGAKNAMHRAIEELFVVHSRVKRRIKSGGTSSRVVPTATNVLIERADTATWTISIAVQTPAGITFAIGCLPAKNVTGTKSASRTGASFLNPNALITKYFVIDTKELPIGNLNSHCRHRWYSAQKQRRRNRTCSLPSRTSSSHSSISDP